jgi:spermidine synthase
VSCMFLHGELVRRKPATQYLTSFYFMLSLGGALGGLLVGLVAPKVLSGYFELPLALIACSILMIVVLEYRSHRATVLVIWLTAAIVFWAAVIYVISYKESSRVMMRNFYGGLRVQEYGKGTRDEIRILVHGTVDHGTQLTAPGRRSEHLSYYGLQSGVGLAIDALPRSPLRVGIIGLGAGSLASYAKPGDVFRFYEINPLVEIIARTEFTYFADCRGKTEIVMGDGRLSLEREQVQNYDLLVVDAFSGDAVPVHLLTRQAWEIYFRHLKDHGILALHITNTHLDLAPVIATLSRELGKYAVKIVEEKKEALNIYGTTWALVSAQPIKSHKIQDVGEVLIARPGSRIWTDDYSNLFQILK